MAKISCSGCRNGQNFSKGIVYCAYCGRQYSGEQIAFSEIEYARETFVNKWYTAVVVLGIVALMFSSGYLVIMRNVFSPVTTQFFLTLGFAAYYLISWFATKYIAKVRTPKLLDRYHNQG